MTPAEATSAATINAAFSLGLADQLGSLAPSRQADFVVMDVADYREIPCCFAWNHRALTVMRGHIIHAKTQLAHGLGHWLGVMPALGMPKAENRSGDSWLHAAPQQPTRGPILGHFPESRLSF